jgi:hypothetical protein
VKQKKRVTIIRAVMGTALRYRMGHVCPLLAAAALASCTTVSVSGGQATRDFGVLRIAPSAQSPLTIVNIQGIGLVPTSNGLTLGASRETVAYMSKSDPCRVIFFIQSKQDIDDVVNLFKAHHLNADSICEIQEGKK